MIIYNNQAPNSVNNVGQFGATEGSIGAYKQAAEYAADAKYWALLAESKFGTIDGLIAEVGRLYKQGLLMQEDIEQLKEDFAAQDIRLMQLISEANAAASNANNASNIANQKIVEIQRQLDILLNMTVTTTTLPAGSQATGTFDPTTGKFAFGIPQGQDGSITDLGSVATGVPVNGDLGFYVDKTTNSVYKTALEDIANLIPSVRSVSLNGGPADSGEVALTVNKATVGLSNVKNVASYSETEINDKLDGFTKLYKTKAEADADSVNRLVGEHVLVWNGASYEFYTVAANKTLTLVSTEGKVLTVNSKEPDSTGNVDILIPTGNPSLYLGEITRFPLGSGSTVTYPGLVQTDGSLIDKAIYPDLGAALVQGNVSVVSETAWQAGEKDSFSWGKLSDGITDADSTNYINIRVPLIADTDSMRSYVVASRDAAVVGVSTVDGVAGAIDLTGKYLQKTDAAATYQTKEEGASKDFVLDSIQPIMSGALFRADPWVVNDTPFRSTGANGVESVDMMKVTPDNSIKIGSYASSVQGVEIHSAGRLQVVDQNDSGVETKYPVYSKRYRPEIEDLPFASIGSYVKDSKGRTIGVTRTGINSDIKQLTQKVTFSQPVTVPDAVGDYDAVTLRQLRNNGGGGGASVNGVMNYGVGQVTLWHSRAFIPSYAVVADGQLLSRTAYPELWAHAQMHGPVTDAVWLTDTKNRAKFSTGDGSTTFRVPDLNGVQTGSIKGLYGKGDGGGTYTTGSVALHGAPDITGSFGRIGDVASINFPISLRTYTGAFSAQGGSTGFTIGTTSGQQTDTTNLPSTLNFAASSSNAAYGRSVEIQGNHFVGVWIIRANGGFTATNTQWQVINADTTRPPNGVSASSGLVSTQYKIGTSVEAETEIRTSAVMGGKYSTILSTRNNTKGVVKNLNFDDEGLLTADNYLSRHGKFIPMTDIGTTKSTFSVDNNVQQSDTNLFNSIVASGQSISTTGYHTTTHIGMIHTDNLQFAQSMWIVAGNIDNTHGCRLIMRPDNSDVMFHTYTPSAATTYTLQKNAISDSRQKHDIEPGNVNKAWSNLTALQFVTFVYNNDEQNRTRRGVIAQQAETVEPLYVKTIKYFDDNNNPLEQKQLDTTPMLLDTMHVVQKLIAEIEALKAEITELKSDK